MKTQNDSRPELKGTKAIGFFGITEEDDNKQILYLYDELRNRYSMDRVSILTQNYSADNADVNIPDPYYISKNGEIIKTGAKVLIDFPFDRQNAVVTGCIMPLGQQDNVRQEIRATKDNMQRKVSLKRIGNTQHYTAITENGKSENLVDGSFSWSTNESISLIAEKVLSLIGEQFSELLGKEVEIGGDNLTKDNVVDNKAELINLFAKKVYIGHSDKRIRGVKDDTIKVDDISQETFNTPILGSLILGEALVQAMYLLIDNLFDAVYLGAGSPVRMSETSKLKIKQQVRQKLPNILSECGFVIKKSDIIKNRDE